MHNPCNKTPLSKRDIWYVVGLFLAVFLVLFLLSDSSSPLSEYYGFDSAIFLLCGRSVANGGVPFKDVFDIKGPMIYFLEAMGQLFVPGRTGAFLLQVFFDSLSVLFLYLSARLFLSRRWSLLAAVASLAFFSMKLEGGNLTEEYCLMPMCLCLYMALRSLSAERSEIPPRMHLYSEYAALSPYGSR